MMMAEPTDTPVVRRGADPRLILAVVVLVQKLGN
jgi:hypothetical protein